MKTLYLFICIFILFSSASELSSQVSIGGYNVYFGHLHNHTSYSDGQGTPEQAYAAAKANGLNFFGLADHSNLLNSTEWSSTLTAADSYNQPGVFTTFRGFEWTTSAYGHVAVINTPTYISAADAAYNIFPELISWLNTQDQNCFAFFNHPGDYNSGGTEFDHFPSNLATDKFVGMEFWNKSVSFTRYYASLAGVMVNGFFSGDGMPYYDEALQRSWKIAPSGSEDNHTATWGANGYEYKVGVLAAANTRADLLAAFKARRFFSTMDKNTALSFKLNGSEMGSTITAGSYTLQIQVSDGDSETFSKVELLKDGVVVNDWSPGVTNVNITGSLTASDGEYYYIRVYQNGNLIAVSAPVWISGEPANVSPTVNISDPSTGAQYQSPASVSIAASASDIDGSIAKVGFYQGTILLGEDTSAPYTYSWSDVIAGSYTLTARATDDKGDYTDSDPVTITVNESLAFDQIGPLCQYSIAPPLPVFSNNTEPVKGYWSPALINTYTTGTTIYTFTPYPGQQSGSGTMSVTVNAAPVPVFSPIGPFRAGEQIDQLTVHSVNGITGNWSPELNNTQTTTYRFTPSAGQCGTNSWTTITIND